MIINTIIESKSDKASIAKEHIKLFGVLAECIDY